MERPGNIKLCYKEYNIHLKAKFKLLLCQRKMNVCIMNNSETSIKMDINPEVCDCDCVVCCFLADFKLSKKI